MSDPSNSIVSTTLTVAVSANTLFNLALGYVTWKLRTGAAQVGRLEERLERQQEAASKKQHELTDKLIDARMRDFTHDVADLIADVRAAHQIQKDFAAETRDAQQALSDRDHADELKHMREMQEIKIEVAKEVVTKADLREAIRDLKAEFARQCKE